MEARRHNGTNARRYKSMEARMNASNEVGYTNAFRYRDIDIIQI